MPKIRKKTTIAIVGLGYVGLPLTILAAKSGIIVYGLDKDKEKIRLLQNRKNYLSDAGLTRDLEKVIGEKKLIPATHFSILKKCQAILICLPTPVYKNFKPDLRILKNAAGKIGPYLKKGSLVINESTVAIGTTREILGKILEKKSGLKMGQDFYLACSPERVDPGTANKTENIAKLIGGINEQSGRRAYQIYQKFIKAPLEIVASLEIAEGAKMLENSYRALNIALVNELALLCEKINLDVTAIIAAASTKWSFQAHWPSLGTGGHCIPVDPHYLTDLARDKGVTMKSLEAGMATNHQMPLRFAAKIVKAYKKGMRILIYGLAYKKNIKDLRESPSLTVCRLLQKRKVSFQVYDPFYATQEIRALGFTPGRVKKGIYDLVVIATDHDTLQKDAAKIISKNTVVLDGKNYFQKKVGKKVIGVGRTL
ncbi:UDP-N-acetyl-D-glucosamine dehydrogenase [bacterium (Candidatus Torokbacteria) CG09_land_8_20_14_0_10_42_11]|nr:MAG: UDP-N-acetyl-D-glucosamine dehydrogenase [bacterium (Candidatus Torokbacteria) CG09_land_8_20_14_0_10_42_11]